MVGVAQLVEHLVVAQDAAGSSPVTHPIKKINVREPMLPFYFSGRSATPETFQPFFSNLIKNICLLAYFLFL